MASLTGNAFSVILKEDDIPIMGEILKGIPEDMFEKMRQNVVEVRRYFKWHLRPVKFDEFHMVMYELWKRRHVISAAGFLRLNADSIKRIRGPHRRCEKARPSRAVLFSGICHFAGEIGSKESRTAQDDLAGFKLQLPNHSISKPHVAIEGLDRLTAVEFNKCRETGSPAKVLQGTPPLLAASL
uniref:Uncharacterized protein n=1 Tax=Salix viminalis TaxID=40686 RepID=A0A6N2KI11_SALVM